MEKKQPVYRITMKEWNGIVDVVMGIENADSEKMEKITEAISGIFVREMEKAGLPEETQREILVARAEEIRCGIMKMRWLLRLMERDGVIRIDYPETIELSALQSSGGKQESRSPDHSNHSPEDTTQNHPDEQYE